MAAIAALGFPEFESSHLLDFSNKAQFSKSAASTIPPHPRVIPLQSFALHDVIVAHQC